MKHKKTILILAVIYISFATPALAQFELPNIGNIKPAIVLNSDPATPLPNSTVTITANLAGITEAGDSNYIWFLNGARHQCLWFEQKCFQFENRDHWHDLQNRR